MVEHGGCGHARSTGKQHFREVGEVRHRVDCHFSEEPRSEPARRVLKERHGGQQQSDLPVRVQIARNLPRKCLGELIASQWLLRPVRFHPVPGQLVVLGKLRGFQPLPRRVPDDPSGSLTLQLLLPRALEEVAAKDVLIPQFRKLELRTVLQVRRMDVVEQREDQAQLANAASVGVDVDAEYVSGKKLPKLRRTRSRGCGRRELLLDHPAVALDEKRPGATRGVEDPCPLLQRATRLQLGEHEVHERNRCVVRAALSCLALTARLIGNMKELLIDDGEGFDRDVREIVRLEVQVELPAPVRRDLISLEGSGDAAEMLPLRCAAATRWEREYPPVKPILESPHDLVEALQCRVAAEDLLRSKPPAGKLLGREDSTVPQIVEVHVLSDESVRDAPLQTAFVPQPLIELLETPQKPPVDAILGSHLAPPASPEIPAINSVCVKSVDNLRRLIEIGEHPQDSSLCGSRRVTVAESRIEPDAVGRIDEQERNDVLVPNVAMNLVGFSLGRRVADVDERHDGGRRSARIVTQHVDSAEVALLVSGMPEALLASGIPEDVAIVESRLELLLPGAQEVGRPTVPECIDQLG